MTKLELFNKVNDEVFAVLDEIKISKANKDKIAFILENYLAPKKGGGSRNAPILDDEGNIIEAWCRFHQRYEKIDDMVVSQGKSKGYCKASISKWNKVQTKIKALDKKAVEYMGDGDFDNAQKIALESKELKEFLNSPDFYNYDEDWEVFNNAKK